MNKITKAAANAATNILKGGSTTLSADDMERALLALAETHARDGETVEQAFVRLIDERDPTAGTIAKALDVLRDAERQARSTSDLRAVAVQREEDALDHFVKSRQHEHEHESTAQAYARLSQDTTFSAIYARLSRARDDLP